MYVTLLWQHIILVKFKKIIINAIRVNISDKFIFLIICVILVSFIIFIFIPFPLIFSIQVISLYSNDLLSLIDCLFIVEVEIIVKNHIEDIKFVSGITVLFLTIVYIDRANRVIIIRVETFIITGKVINDIIGDKIQFKDLPPVNAPIASKMYDKYVFFLQYCIDRFDFIGAHSVIIESRIE